MQDEWTEKYRPKSLSQIVGNEIAAESLRRWGESWKKGTPKVKALTLEGAPGVGKTSAALALAHDMGWDVIEMNASDHRNATSIKRVAGLGSSGQTFSSSGEFLSSNEGKRKLVILDEADNLSGKEDRGGPKEIVEMIKDAGQPVILIVNDYRELTRKASAVKKLTHKISFKAVDARSIVKALKAIIDLEKVSVSDSVLQRIAENAAGDLRAAVNDLQMIVEGKQDIRIEDTMAMGNRNQRRELETALGMMFGAKGLREARDATLDVDETPDDLEKWIDENIPLEFKNSEDMASAFSALSRSDMYLGWTRRYQDYGLWSYAKELMTGGVALSRKHGSRPDVWGYRFPGFFIMLSRSRGPRAQRESISSKLTSTFHTSKRAIIESVLPYIAYIARKDDEFAFNLCKEAQLDEGDIAYLLGEEIDSPKVLQLTSRLKESGDLPEEAPKSRKPSRGRSATRF